MKFPLYTRVALTVDVPAEGVRRGDVVTVVEWHPAPSAGAEPGYSVEVFNALGKTLAVLTLPESSFEALRRDEVLSVRSLSGERCIAESAARSRRPRRMVGIRPMNPTVAPFDLRQDRAEFLHQIGYRKNRLGKNCFENAPGACVRWRDLADPSWLRSYDPIQPRAGAVGRYDKTVTTPTSLAIMIVGGDRTIDPAIRHRLRIDRKTRIRYSRFISRFLHDAPDYSNSADLAHQTPAFSRATTVSYNP